MSGGGFSSAVHVSLQEGIQAILILPRIFLFFVNDESGVAVDAVADRFIHALKGLNVDDFNQNILPVFLG
jgi:hypothetical protein